MSILSSPFTVNTVPFFDIYQSRQIEHQRRTCRSYRDWILNVIKTLRFVENADFVRIDTPSTGRYWRKIIWVTPLAGTVLMRFIDDPMPFYVRPSKARKKYKEAFRTGVFRCCYCDKELPVSLFAVDNSKGYPALHPGCRPCNNDIKAARRTRYYQSLEKSLSWCMESVRTRSRRHEIPFDIDLPFLMELWSKQGGLCFYSGLPMEYQRKARGNYTGRGGFSKNNPAIASVDRIEPAAGYVRTNSVLCRWAVNQMKADLPLQVFYDLVSAIHNNQPPNSDSQNRFANSNNRAS